MHGVIRMKATSLWLFSLLPAVGSAFIIQEHAAATSRHVLPVVSAVFHQDQRRIRPTRTARSHPQKLRRSNSAAITALQMKNQQKTTTNSYSNYSDDFFGLIFLSPVLLGDQVFSIVFLVASALAAIATNATKRHDGRGRHGRSPVRRSTASRRNAAVCDGGRR
jgi:hypothetical protein